MSLSRAVSLAIGGAALFQAEKLNFARSCMPPPECKMDGAFQDGRGGAPFARCRLPKGATKCGMGYSDEPETGECGFKVCEPCSLDALPSECTAETGLTVLTECRMSQGATKCGMGYRDEPKPGHCGFQVCQPCEEGKMQGIRSNMCDALGDKGSGFDAESKKFIRCHVREGVTKCGMGYKGESKTGQCGFRVCEPCDLSELPSECTAETGLEELTECRMIKGATKCGMGFQASPVAGECGFQVCQPCEKGELQRIRSNMCGAHGNEGSLLDDASQRFIRCHLPGGTETCGIGYESEAIDGSCGFKVCEACSSQPEECKVEGGAGELKGDGDMVVECRLPNGIQTCGMGYRIPSRAGECRMNVCEPLPECKNVDIMGESGCLLPSGVDKCEVGYRLLSGQGEGGVKVCEPCRLGELPPVCNFETWQVARETCRLPEGETKCRMGYGILPEDGECGFKICNPCSDDDLEKLPQECKTQTPGEVLDPLMTEPCRNTHFPQCPNYFLERTEAKCSLQICEPCPNVPEPPPCDVSFYEKEYKGYWKAYQRCKRGKFECDSNHYTQELRKGGGACPPTYSVCEPKPVEIKEPPGAKCVSERGMLGMLTGDGGMLVECFLTDDLSMCGTGYLKALQVEGGFHKCTPCGKPQLDQLPKSECVVTERQDVGPRWSWPAGIVDTTHGTPCLLSSGTTHSTQISCAAGYHANNFSMCGYDFCQLCPTREEECDVSDAGLKGQCRPANGSCPGKYWMVSAVRGCEVCKKCTDGELEHGPRSQFQQCDRDIGAAGRWQDGPGSHNVPAHHRLCADGKCVACATGHWTDRDKCDPEHYMPRTKGCGFELCVPHPSQPLAVSVLEKTSTGSGGPQRNRM